MSDRVILTFLGIWFALWGILHVTNIEVTWRDPIMGFSALAVGGVCLARALTR